MTPDEYVGRCRALVISVADDLPAEELGWAMHLIDHDEPAEGLVSLAWSLETAKGCVEPETALRIVSLINGLVPVDSLPPSVQAAAMKRGGGGAPLSESE